MLISNSTLHGSGYLDHCESEIKSFLNDKDVESVLFIPYARPSGKTYDEYTGIAKERFQRMGFDLVGIQERVDSDDAVRNAEAIFIGGGNTFVLLDSLYGVDIIPIIKARVRNGMPYIGTSAGANVAGRTIMTTNDMPIIYPPCFDAMGLIPFNINPHYIDSDPNSKHMGETRETRIREYHVFNDNTVVGLREGAMLHVKNNEATLKGSTGARIFRKGKEPTEYRPGESLDFLLTN